MIRHAIHCILFTAIGAMIAIQFDPVEGALIDGYFGLRLVMYASFIAALTHFVLLAGMAFDETQSR